MDDKAKEILRMGLLSSQSHREEMFQYMGIVQQFDEALASTREMLPLCRELVRIILNETQFERCSVFLWNRETESLQPTAASNVEDLLCGDRAKQGMAFHEWQGFNDIVRQVYVSKVPVFIEDFSVSHRTGTQGQPVVPMALASMPISEFGVLNLTTRRRIRFTFHVKRNWQILTKIIGYLIKSAFEAAEGACDLHGFSARSTGEGDPLVDLGASRPMEGMDRLMANALDHIPQGICMLQSSGHVARLNESMKDLYGGAGASKLVGRFPSVFFGDPKDFDALMEQSVREGRGELLDATLVNEKGEKYSADLFLTCLPVEKGRSGGYLLVVNDVSKKKAFAQKMLQTEKLVALGTMAGGVAHDFNNLLMAILGHIQLLVPQLEDGDVIRRLQNIEKAVVDGSHIIRRLQRFTERERDRGLMGVPVDVHEAFRDVVELTKPRWKNAMEKLGHTVRFQLECEPKCMALMHGSDLREVLTNLIFNAVEAMPEGGIITLKSRVGEAMVFIEVRDTGIGMSRELAGKIFDPFYTTKGIGNSGLGLSVCWSLIVRHGGEIRVDSAPGKGTTFLITLPRAQSVVRHGNAQEERRQSASYRILIVDDDEEILGILRDMLRLKGHRVNAVSEGAKALELLESNRYDLVLTDLGMPVISGWEVAKRVKEIDPGVPVVLVTGWGAQYEEEDLSDRGVDMVLSKPLSWDKLLSSLGKLLALEEFPAPA